MTSKGVCMILNKLITSAPVHQITSRHISLIDLEEMLNKGLTEVPIVLCNSFVGIIQRRTIVQEFIHHSDFTNMPIDNFIIKTDHHLLLSDTNDEILHKVNRTIFRVIPIFDLNNNYIATLHVASILRELLSEQEFIIHQYETLFSGIENPYC